MTASRAEIGAFQGFGERALDFYEGLAADNSRTYWTANEGVYREHVAEPLRALAAELAAEFGEPKIFRPHRDLRFSADKRPYQEHASMSVGRDGGGLYLALSVDGLLIAGGYYQPDRDQLDRFRHLQDDPDVTADLDARLEALARHGYRLGQEGMLKTAPRGWSREHPRIDMLRRTSLAVWARHDPDEWLHGRACLDVVRDGWRVVDTWNVWLRARVGSPRSA
ncbi:MAG TPA: DUF2461 domain-containing protein [Kineosporiaceae bacterium]|nr:DUF2461 domain-containing protein [Kineosporiaceae bacterium]